MFKRESLILNFKIGFTLAEVLITLVVVGVIAAMTIPTIIYETKKTEYSARLKKFYSTMKQLELMAKAKNKSWDVWAEDTHSGYGVDIVEDFVKEYLLPFMQYSKSETIDSWVLVYLNDGSYFKIGKGQCLDFVFDVNGGKKPDIEGNDEFRFLYCPKGNTGWNIISSFIPYQYSEYSRETALNLCSTNGSYCSALLLIDGWEFKDDYPHKI